MIQRLDNQESFLRPDDVTPSGPSIAVVGMACIFPDCNGPDALWEMVLSKRRAFRQLPSERLNAADYGSNDPAMPDRTYSMQGAVIEGYAFDRLRFKIMGTTFRSADMTHWLALDVAARALEDAGFGHDLSGFEYKQTTGVLLGNTLTGEFSRANVMRLRWPYVKRVMDEGLKKEGWDDEKRRSFLAALEVDYKKPFPDIGEESLAGGLSNTIAGRICNYFNFNGGGFTLDGACASSLLAIANACSMLTQGDLDFCLAGGVDLSLDPFELVGFAKTQALARKEMLVFDRDSAGFWPGEGCGMVALMRAEDAIKKGCRIDALIRGWGISSDGEGGITRPEKEGQLLAIERAYARAGFGADTVACFEAHGTGTKVGDETELAVLVEARKRAGGHNGSAVIGSIKANIGHTKAAAGVAGFIKACMSLRHQTIPPHTGILHPHPILEAEKSHLEVCASAKPWDPERPMRCGVSGMGFGGINAHLVLESGSEVFRPVQPERSRYEVMSRSAQDVELFVFSANSRSALKEALSRVAAYAGRLARCEMIDLAVALSKEVSRSSGWAEWKAGIIARTPSELSNHLQSIQTYINEGEEKALDLEQGICFGKVVKEPSVGFLFPGQASPVYTDSGCFGKRWAWMELLYDRYYLPSELEPHHTALAQPAIALATSIGVELLEKLGVRASIGIGHSLGELVALHWAGGMNRDQLMQLAFIRGDAMGGLKEDEGCMAAVSASADQIFSVIKDTSVTITGYNARQQTVIGGRKAEMDQVCEALNSQGIRTILLPVQHAFHTDEMAPAADDLRHYLTNFKFNNLERNVISTVTGKAMERGQDLRELLSSQILKPVRFTDAVAAAHESSDYPMCPDLWIEVGPGEVLQGVMRSDHMIPVVSLDVCGSSLVGLLKTCAASFVLGAPMKFEQLFEERFYRPFSLEWSPRFLSNPCELNNGAEAGAMQGLSEPRKVASLIEDHQQKEMVEEVKMETSPKREGQTVSPLAAIKARLSEYTELPEETLNNDLRMLNDLHLNSITVGKVISRSARDCGVAAPMQLTDYANASIQEIVDVLEGLVRGKAQSQDKELLFPDGLANWVRVFEVKWVPSDGPVVQCKNSLTRSTEAVGKEWKCFETGKGGEDFILRIQPLLEGAFPQGGVLLCVGRDICDPPVELLLESSHYFLKEKGLQYFIVIQEGNFAGGFVRTFHLEHPKAYTLLLTMPFDHKEAAERLLDGIRNTRGFAEIRLDQSGPPLVPEWHCVDIAGERDEETDLSSDETEQGVLLVTGGGKGIAAECAIHLASRWGWRLGLIGRSDMETDQELKSNLSRMQKAGLRVSYQVADVTDIVAVSKAVKAIEKELGSITGLLHSAGNNHPCLIQGMDADAFQQALEPKINGLRNVLADLSQDRLKWLITFSSIIGRMGLAGEAHYATANEWLSELTCSFQVQNPGCRCLALEWSLWSGTGMGQRLGTIDALMQQGIHAISIEEGLNILDRFVSAKKPASGSCVVSGRFGNPSTVRLPPGSAELLRFLENIKVLYPGVECVIENRLSSISDPYLSEHTLQGQGLFPAVMGMEAMAQASVTLLGRVPSWCLRNVRLSKPISVGADEEQVIRVVGLKTGSSQVRLAIRCADTDFRQNHFEAEVSGMHKAVMPGEKTLSAGILGEVSLDIEKDLYERLLFHEGRFRLVERYQMLSSRECLAEVAPQHTTGWFGRYASQELLLGDPGERDACLHAIQACIPHRRVLPLGFDSIQICATKENANGGKWVHAVQTRWQDDFFVYDVSIYDRKTKILLETWKGLQLRAVEDLPVVASWPMGLLGPYMEWKLGEYLPDRPVIDVEWCEGTSPTSVVAERLLRRGKGEDVPDLVYRPDGKPLTIAVSETQSVSVSHAGSLTLAVAGKSMVACDLVELDQHSKVDLELILDASDRSMAEVLNIECGIPFKEALARVWAARESLKKAGAHLGHHLILHDACGEGWIILKSGDLMIAGNCVQLKGGTSPIVFAVLSGELL